MRRNQTIWIASLFSVSAALAGCGGGSSSNTPPTPTPTPAPTPSPAPPPAPTPLPTPAPATYSIGGSVSGLASGAWVVLLNNGGNNLTVTQNGNFAFSNPLTSGATYAVTIGQQPVGQTCTVTQGNDSVVGSNVTNVQVSCANSSSPTPPPPVATHSVGGTVSGLAANVVLTLQNNGADTTQITANGRFQFATPVAQGASYAVMVSAQPSGQTCSVANASGVMGNGDVSTVGITCVSPGMTVLHSFVGQPDDGNYPQAGLFMDAQGNLFGTTRNGGADKLGTVFEVAPDGTETLIHSFTGGTTDGATPIGGLVMDSHGNLFGTANKGGSNGFGAVYKLTPDGQGGYTESLFYSFAGGVAFGNLDGQYPQSALIIDANDNLYGTTPNGGGANTGMLFKLNPAGVPTTLYSFTLPPSSVDPQSSLIQDASGNLYGTTPFGGAYDKGTAYRVSPDGTYTLLWSFGEPHTTDAADPFTPLTLDPTTGVLYGTSALGGDSGNGAVFKLTPDANAPSGYSESVVYSFIGPTDGKLPYSGLLRDPAGNLYGTTYAGGAFGGGTLFEIPAGGTFKVLYAFGITLSDGRTPYGDLIRDASGYLYGTTYYGGATGNGTVFRFLP